MPRSRPAKTPTPWIFLVGLLVYIVSHVGFEAYLTAARPSLYETDDQYHFLIKAENTAHCLAQNCPGLNDLYDQTTLPPTSAAMAFSQAQVKHRALLAYHPLHSVALIGLQKVGQTPEQSLTTLNMLLHALAGLAIGALLWRLFGAAAASLALMLLSVFWFNPGTWVMTPFFGAVIFCFGAWALLLGQGRGRWIGAAALLALACGFHTTGAVMALLTAGWVGLQHVNLRAKYLGLNTRVVAFGGAMVALAAITVSWQLQFVPAKINFATIYAEASLAHALVKNLFWLKDLMLPLAEQYGLALFMAALVVAAVTLPSAKRRALGAMLIGLGGLTVASLLYPSPDVSLLQRVWPLLVVLLMGSLAHMVVWAWQHHSLPPVRRWPVTILQGWSAATPKPLTTVPVGLLANLVLVISVLIGAYAVAFGGTLVPYALLNMRENKNVVLSLPQFAEAARLTPTSGKVLYVINQPSLSPHADEMQEAVIYAALTHGLHSRGLAIAPYMQAHPAVLAAQTASLTTLIRTNPLVTLTGSDAVLGPQPYTLAWATPTQTLAVWLMAPAAATLTFTPNGAEPIAVAIPKPYTGWVEIPLTKPTSGGTLAYAGPRARWLGVRLSEGQPTFWPWQNTLTVTFQPGNMPPVAAVFEANSLSTLPRCTTPKVLNDTGSLVVARIVCTNLTPSPSIVLPSAPAGSKAVRL